MPRLYAHSGGTANERRAGRRCPVTREKDDRADVRAATAASVYSTPTQTATPPADVVAASDRDGPTVSYRARGTACGPC